MTLLNLLSYGGVVLAAAFVILSLASGLLWISELIEEHSRTAKTVGIRVVYGIIILQTLLYFTDSLPLFHCLFSIICHVVYLQNLGQSWPFISLTSLSFVASCVLAIANHFLWFFFFSNRARSARIRPHATHGGNLAAASAKDLGFADIATFFAICIWLTPLFLFLSLSANDNALPVASSDASYSPAQPITTRISLFKSVVDCLPWMRRRSRAQGILVSHTPTHSSTSSSDVMIVKESFTDAGYAFVSRRSASEDDSMHPGSEGHRVRSRVALRSPPKEPPSKSARAAVFTSEDSYAEDMVSGDRSARRRIPRR